MTSGSEVLRAVFDHHVWATLTLLEALEALDEEQLGATIGGTYGSMPQTLTHLVDADSRYLRRFDDPSLPSEPSHRIDPPPELARRMREHAPRWSAILDRLDAGTLDSSIVDHAEYPDTQHAEGMLLIQAIQHGEEHRQQVCSTLGALGLDVPDLSGWEYWLATR